jgi:predicted amidohydrolase
MKDLELSLVQMRSILGEPDLNLGNMVRRIESLASGSDIICFPEACLTGYTSKGPERFSIPVSDERIERIRDAAADNGVTVVFGFLETSGTELHVTQAVADNDRNLHLYRKTHLGRDERGPFTPGNEIRPFSTPKAKVGMQLCWESHFPEISCKLRKGGAELILISYASPMSGSRRRNIWMNHVPARAADNCVFVGVVNSVGDSGGGSVFGGGSMVVDPKGKVIGEYFGTDENVLTVSLSSKDKDSLGSDEDMGKIDYFLYRREDLY